MSKADKILEKVMSGQSDANITFGDMCYLLQKLGFNSRQRGGSHNYLSTRPRVREFAKFSWED